MPPTRPQNTPTPVERESSTDDSLRPRRVSPCREETRALLRRYAETRELSLRNELVLRHERLVRYLAARFVPRGVVSAEDLVQAGYLGLIRAIERFDPEAGVNFSSFAAPTIVGVIKHYLRDHTWCVSGPRRLREAALKLRGLRDRLEQDLGRSPTLPEAAAAAGLTEEGLVQAMEMDSLYYARSLDEISSDSHGDAYDRPVDCLASNSDEYREVDERDWIRRALENLDARERAVLYGRYYGEYSQTEVARELEISQMHVSRLERRALARLRALLA